MYSFVHPSWRALAFLILILYLVILAPARRVDYWIRLNTLSAALIALIVPNHLHCMLLICYRFYQTKIVSYKLLL